MLMFRLFSSSQVAACIMFCAASFWWQGEARCETYVIDREYSEVRFRWDYLGVTRQSGEFRDIIGRVSYDPISPLDLKADVQVMVASLDTGVSRLDQLLVHSGDFFDTERFPTIRFVSTGMRMTNAKNGIISGDLTINGITKPVEFQAILNFSGEHPMAKINPSYTGVQVLGVSLEGRILRSAWELDRAIPFVSDEIFITIEAQMNRAR